MVEIPQWRLDENALDSGRVRAAGASLFQHLLVLFAQKKLSAKDFAIACHWCSEARVPGAEFGKYAAAPGQSSNGKYQRQLDRALPPFGPLYWVNTPLNNRRTSARETKLVPTNPLHEAIAREVRANPDLLAEVARREWPPAYWAHPVVRQAQAAGDSLPVPVVLYLDGVRFSAPLAGRTDSVLGFWGYTATTQRRHFLASLRSQDLCRCGCGGWCIIFPIMLTLSWSLRAVATGLRPQRRHDGAWAPDDAFGQLASVLGNEFGFKAILLWVKGDWSEVSHTLGLPAVTSHHNPCPFCTLRQPELHERYRLLSLPPRTQGYGEACRSREVEVTINSEEERAAMVRSLKFMKSRLGHGRVLTTTVALGGGVVLQPGHRLEPSPTMPDCMLLDHAALPVTVVLWRPRLDFSRRSMDASHHRNPLFTAELQTEPSEVLTIDSLHTVYYGPIMRWSACTLWRVLLSNPWQLQGSLAVVLEAGVRRMNAHLQNFFVEHQTPHDKRLSELTLAMLGDRRGCELGGQVPHPGCAMKTKAAETGNLLPWALQILREFGAAVPFRGDLVVAGESLQQWLEVVRESEVVLDPARAQRLQDACQRHLVSSRRAMVRHVPKHDFFTPQPTG